MSLIIGESGKLFGYNTNFDLTDYTTISLEFIDPFWGTPIVIDPSRLSVGGVDKDFHENGEVVTYLAGQYIQFIILETDFIITGSWYACGTYININTSPEQNFKGELKSFYVGDSC